MVFVNDESTVLTAKFTQNGHAALKVFQQRWSVVEQRQRAGDVCVGPRLIAEPVQRINDRRRIAMSADVGATGQEQVGSKALHVVKIMHVVERFSSSENLIARRVNDLKVAEHLNLEVCGDIGSTIARLTGQRVGQGVQSKRAVERHAVEAVHRVEQEG